MNRNIEIEERVLAVCNKLLEKWNNKFKELSITVDELSIYRNDSPIAYFSEIEFNFWSGNLLKTCTSLIIFMENELYIDLDNLENDINEEIEICYQECIDSKN